MKNNSPATIALSVLRGCRLERRGWPCGLCEADRRTRHVARCTREDCWLCELIEGTAEDTFRLFCTVEYRARRLGRAA